MMTKPTRIVMTAVMTVLACRALRAEVEAADTKAASVLPIPVADVDELLAYLPPVVGRYKDQELTAAEVRKAVAPQLRMQAGAEQPAVPPDFRKWVYLLVKSMLQQRLLFDLARQADYHPNPAEAKQVLERMARNIGPAKYRKTLAEQGLTVEEVTRRLAEGQVINRWINDTLKPENEVTEAEAKAFYDENVDGPLFQVPETLRTAQILIRLMMGATDATRAATRAEAEQLRARLAAGEAFASLAREHSDHPSSKNGGDMGYLPRGRMPKPYDKAAFALGDGEISDIVESRLGYHLIQRTALREPHTGRFEDVRERLLRELGRRRVQDAIHGLYGNALEAGDIEILIPET